MSDRIATMSDFWPYYLGEHRNPTSRMLHFVGTSGFFLSVLAGFAYNPIGCAVAGVLAAVFGYVGATRVEPVRPAFLPILAMIVVLVIAAPTVLGGIVSAYAFAWVGHFRVEHNRPATFKYPIWSLFSDFRLWGLMVTGKLWTGDSLAQAR